MGSRRDLQVILERLGSAKAYFQPPASVKMSYPCFVYSLDSMETTYADNFPYKQKKRYQVILISVDGDEPLFEEIANMQECRFERSFTADKLYHFIFQLFF